MAFYFTSILKGVLCGLFNLKTLLTLISFLPPLQFSHTLYFLAFPLGFLPKNKLSSTAILGLASPLHFHLLHIQRLVFSAPLPS